MKWGATGRDYSNPVRRGDRPGQAQSVSSGHPPFGLPRILQAGSEGGEPETLLSWECQVEKSGDEGPH